MPNSSLLFTQFNRINLQPVGCWRLIMSMNIVIKHLFYLVRNAFSKPASKVTHLKFYDEHSISRPQFYWVVLVCPIIWDKTQAREVLRVKPFLSHCEWFKLFVGFKLLDKPYWDRKWHGLASKLVDLLITKRFCPPFSNYVVLRVQIELQPGHT